MGSVPSECCSTDSSECQRRDREQPLDELCFDLANKTEQHPTEQDTAAKYERVVYGESAIRDSPLCVFEAEGAIEDDDGRTGAVTNEGLDPSAAAMVFCASRIEGKWHRENGEVLGRIAKSWMSWEPPGPGVASAYEHEDSLLEPVGEYTVSMFLEGATYEGELISRIDAEGRETTSIRWSDGELWVKAPDG
eukprot:TRINITY_DN34373_c0_g1_i1.p1 TRINITY_DN34373_c0_g1~~TRINITY_DN34373_c0_g1_i1.p1  ORF type:complete len:192 (+),score=23.46 TRINITY_DN34373_c0_g1_i1:109-684(+)